MNLISFEVIAFAIPAVLFAGISKGGFSGGASFAGAAILALVLDPVVVIGVMLPLLMLMDVRLLPAYWKKWSWEESLVLILGAVPGVVLGAVTFSTADADIIRILIGGLSLLFVIWQMTKHFLDLQRQVGKTVGFVCGGVAGFTSYVAHAGGPPAAIYLLGRNLSKTQYQATTVLVFWVINGLKVGFYGAIGMFTVQTMTLGIILAPVAILGAWIGIRLHHTIPDRIFFLVTYVLLSLTGAKLIWSGLT